MTGPHEELKRRLVDVVCHGRGAAGELGADALARSIPAGRFRLGLDGAPLRDPAYPAGAFDRATRWTWRGERDEDEPGNDRDPTGLFVARVALEVGYRYGAGSERTICLAPGTGETLADAVAAPEARAFRDALRIRLALQWDELVQHAPGASPAIYDVHREGETTTEDLGAGRLVSATVYVVRYSLDLTQPLDW